MKILIQIYSKNHVLAVQFVPPQITRGGKIKSTSLIFTIPFSLLFRTKNVFFYFHFTGTFIKENFINMYYKIPSRLFSMNCS